MIGKPPDKQQLHLLKQHLENLINPDHPLCRLAKSIPWDDLEKHFEKHYHYTGRPSKPIRLMISLLVLKQLHDLSDETIVERWVENPYFQYFSGETIFQWEFPCHPTDLVYFRKRIGEDGIKKIFQMSIDLHGKKAKETEVLVDTTVQEKNITFPTDMKLYRRIIEHCLAIADKEAVNLRQSYKRVVKKLMLAQRFRNHPKNHKKAVAAQRRLKTIAGRLVRELERKLPASTLARYSEELKLFQQILDQKKDSKNKIYSIHEPQVYCISKGKEHKKYEYGSKVSIVVTKNSGIIVGAVNFSKNYYDGHTLPEALKQTKELVGKRPDVAICDRGYKGNKFIDGTQIVIPKNPGKRASTYERQKARKRFRKRAGIEPIIGHLKSDFKLIRNYLKGSVGDSINLMLAATAFNLRKLLRQLLDSLLLFFMVQQRRLLASVQ
jgi:transposase, IS5 family